MTKVAFRCVNLTMVESKAINTFHRILWSELQLLQLNQTRTYSRFGTGLVYGGFRFVYRYFTDSGGFVSWNLLGYMSRGTRDH